MGITTDGDEELPVFIERLGLSLASPRCKSLKQADYVELHCCLDFRFHNGGLLFAAQLFHNCNISRSQNHIMFRGQKENVMKALSSIAEQYSKADRKVSSRKKRIVTSLFP